MRMILAFLLMAVIVIAMFIALRPPKKSDESFRTIMPECMPFQKMSSTPWELNPSEKCTNFDDWAEKCVDVRLMGLNGD